MFEQKSLDKIDGDYFNIIIADSQDVTIQSRNTGHYWYLHCAGYPTEEALVIFHKHRFKDGYHQHGHARNLRQAIKSIVRHDDYQLNVDYQNRLKELKNDSSLFKFLFIKNCEYLHKYKEICVANNFI